MQVRTTVAEVVVEVRTTLGALRPQGTPPLWLKEMVPVNPLTAVIRIVEVPGVPTSTNDAVGVAEIE